MRPNRNIRIGIALVGAAVLLWMVSLVLGRLTSRSRPAPQNVAQMPVQPVSLETGGMVAVAAEDIPERSIITEEMLEMKPLSADEPNTDYITDKSAQAVGFISRRPIMRGERLRRAPIDLVGHISEVGVAGAIRPGRRAMIVPILNKPTLHDLVHIGDHVDIVASFDQQESRTIVQNVRVLAVDVFGKDFPQVKVAMRGDYKADAKPGVSTANPPSPGGGNQAGQAGPGGQNPPQNQQPQPQQGQPPAKPEPALTLEVTPDQATALSLAQASNAPLDFILHPRPHPVSVPEVRVAAAIKPRLAPYAERVKQRKASGAQSVERPARTALRESSSFMRESREIAFRPRPMPVPQLPRLPSPTPPAPYPVPRATRQPETYQIPIYGDGKIVRIDTVRKPPTAIEAEVE